MRGTLVTSTMSSPTPLPSAKPLTSPTVAGGGSAPDPQDRERWSWVWTPGHGSRDAHVSRCHAGTYFQKISLALTHLALPDAFCNTQPWQVTATATATATATPPPMSLLAPAPATA